MNPDAARSGRTRGLLILSALAGLLALSVYGFWSRRLPQQTIWQPPGAERFVIFLALLCISSAVLILIRPRWFVPFTAAACALYTVRAAGILAPMATGFFLLACLVLGRLILPDREHRRGTRMDVLALLTGMCVLMWLTGALAHFPVNYPATYWGLLGIVFIARPKTTVSCAGRLSTLFRHLCLGTRRDHAMLAIALAPLLAHWLIVLKPETGADALSMHMVVPAYVASHHLWSFDFRHFVWAVMPMGAVWSYTAAYLLGGEFAARLLNFSLLAAICLLLFGCARRWVDRPTSFLLVALFAATPIVQLVTGSLFVETFYAVLLLGALAALWEFYESKDRVALPVSAFLAASALSVKLTALPFVLPVMGVLAWELIRLYRVGERRWLVTCAVLVMAVAPPPYLYAWWKTGNPAFPYLNSIFKSPYFLPVFSPDNRFREPVTWRTAFDFTFATHRYWEGQDGSAGFQFLLLFPLVFLSVRHTWRRIEWTLTSIAVAGMLVGLILAPNVRYLYPAFPILTLSLALIFWGAAPHLRVALWIVCVACLALNLWFLPSSSWYHKTFCLSPFDPAASENYLAANAPARLLIETLNRRYPAEPALFLGTMDIAGLQGEAYSDGWHCHRFIESIGSLESEEDVLRFFRGLGVHHFIFPNPSLGIPVLEAQVRRFLEDFTEPEIERGPLRLATLKAEFRGGQTLAALPRRQIAPAPPGRYDDFDNRIRFFANWSHNPQFESAAHHSLTYSEVPGARLRFSFTGSAIAWVYAKAYNQGIAQTLLDGEPRAEIDLYYPGVVWGSQTVFAASQAGEHTLEVRFSGRKNPKSSGATINVDELIVR